MTGSNLGLPRYVLSFLRHMESHKDCLKWNIAESSHKITLTLTWNFHTKGGSGGATEGGSLRENLIRKINRTLHIAATQTQQDNQTIPPDIRALLDNVPKKHKRTRLKRRLSLSMSAVRRTLSSSQTSMDRSSLSLARDRYSSPPSHTTGNSSRSQTLPHMSQPSSSSTRHRRGTPMVRNNSFHGSVATYHSTPRSRSFTRTQSTTLAQSRTPPSRDYRSQQQQQHASLYDYEACQSMTTLDYYNHGSSSSQDLLNSPTDETVFNTVNRSPYQQRVVSKLNYRSETSLEESLEELMDRTRRETEARLREIKDEWEETVRDWPNIVEGRASASSARRHSYGFKRSLTSPRLNGDGDIGGEERGAAARGYNGQVTVTRCLDSCEKILTRYETDIK